MPYRNEAHSRKTGQSELFITVSNIIHIIGQLYYINQLFIIIKIMSKYNNYYVNSHYYCCFCAHVLRILGCTDYCARGNDILR
jgi:hypothetical protein